MDVLAGRAAALTGGADALANMAAIDAIYTAAGLSLAGSDTLVSRWRLMVIDRPHNRR